MKTILIKPIITEKSMTMVPDGKYTFEVAKNANKIEITKEINRVYKVDVVKVNTCNIGSRDKVFGMRTKGKTRSWQKAIIRIKKGQKIKDFEVKK